MEQPQDIPVPARPLTGWSRPATPKPPTDHGADPRPGRELMCIDCDRCVMQHTAACDDCVVTFICSREPDEAVIIDVEDIRAIRLLGDVGLVPQLRHRPRTA